MCQPLKMLYNSKGKDGSFIAMKCKQLLNRLIGKKYLQFVSNYFLHSIFRKTRTVNANVLHTNVLLGLLPMPI